MGKTPMFSTLALISTLFDFLVTALGGLADIEKGLGVLRKIFGFFYKPKDRNSRAEILYAYESDSDLTSVDEFIIGRASDFITAGGARNSSFEYRGVSSNDKQ